MTADRLLDLMTAFIVKRFLLLFIQNVKDPLRSRTAGLKDLIQAVQAADRFIHQPEGHQKCGQLALGHVSSQHFTPAKPQDQDRPRGPNKHHRRVIKRPRLHHLQGRRAQPTASRIKTAKLSFFPSVSLDLADPAHVVHQQRIHGTGRLPHPTIPLARRQRVKKRARSQKRQRQQGNHPQPDIELEKQNTERHHLDDRH